MDPLIEAQNLLKRYREGRGFRDYVEARMPLVLLAVLVCLGSSLAMTAATIVFVGQAHTLLTLLAMVAAPLLIGGSLAVLLFLLFSWLEARAMARVGGHATLSARHLLSLPALHAALRQLPVPWILAGVFVLAPFIITALVSARTAAVVLVGALLAPALFLLADR
ncbi:MAG: hypothetical protein ABR570_12950 [Burkholderiales bacterium]